MYKNCRDGGSSAEECNARLANYDPTYDANAPTNNVETDWSDVAAKSLAVVAAVAVVAAAIIAGSDGNGTSKGPYKGNCEFSSNIAADGSLCGDRSAEVRPGGY